MTPYKKKTRGRPKKTASEPVETPAEKKAPDKMPWWDKKTATDPMTWPLQKPKKG